MSIYHPIDHDQILNESDPRQYNDLNLRLLITYVMLILSVYTLIVIVIKKN